MDPIPSRTQINRYAVIAAAPPLLVALLLLWSTAFDTGQIIRAQAPVDLPHSFSENGELQILVGWFSIHWQDDFTDEGLLLPTSKSIRILDVERIDELPMRVTVRLILDEATEIPDGDLELLNQQRVRIEATAVDPSSPDSLGGGTFRVAKIQAEPLASGLSFSSDDDAILGSQPWVILRCRFPDQPIPSESGTAPGSVGYFRALINNPNGLNAYVNATSYGKANLNGSSVVDGWFDLPQNRAEYAQPNSPERLDVIEAGGDCIEAADLSVSFTPYVGIGLVFNDGECCQGGFRFLSLDGENRVWGVTYMSSDAPHHVWAHELGHGFGLPHTAGNGREYNDPWSIMGASACFIDPDPTLGCIGQHPISEQKLSHLGWLEDDQVVTIPSASRDSLTLGRLAQPPSGNPLLIRVPIQGSDSRFYTIESRSRIGFDDNLPADAVVIHLVDQNKPSNLQADLVGIPPSDSYYFPSDATIWSPGRDFVDAANDIRIQVVATAGNGHVVNVQNGSLPLQDVVISGPEVSQSSRVSFIGDARPITASVPITYFWEASELESIQTVGETSSQVEFVWTSPGTKVVTVTASNPANVVVATKLLELLGADLALTTSNSSQSIVEGEQVMLGYNIRNLGPDIANNVELAVALNNIDDFSVATRESTEFARGTLDAVVFDNDASGIILSDEGRALGEGIYESPILDGEQILNWTSIEWQPRFPTGKALPGSAQREVGYASGAVDMAGNVLLLHLDEAPGARRFANSAGAGLPDAKCTAARCPVADAEGRINAAMSFDGKSSLSVEANPRLNFGTTGFSQELWFFPIGRDSGPMGLLGAGEGSNQYPSLYYEENGIRFRFGHQDGSAWVQSADSVVANSWNHVAVSFDGVTFGLFVNGDEVYRTEEWAGLISRPAPSGILIGQVEEAFFTGRIDEVALYRRALTTGEVADRYRRGVTRLGFQVRSCESADCSGGTYRGPDGTDGSFYSEGSIAEVGLPSLFVAGNAQKLEPSNRYIQYRAVLGSDDPAITPALQSVTMVPSFGTASNGRCRGTNQVACMIESLNVDESVQIQISFDALRSGTIRPVVTLGAATFDPTVTNNQLDDMPIVVEPTNGPIEGAAPRGQLVTFDSEIDAGPNGIYRWDFGDGNSGTGSPVSHIYVSPGIYTITLTVTREGGEEPLVETREIRILEQIFLPNIFG